MGLMGLFLKFEFVKILCPHYADVYVQVKHKYNNVFT